MDDVLERFSPATAAWFRGAFDAPTAAQAGAWEAISTGSHALVVAPTGSGKTLASFLWSIDRLASPEEATRRRERADAEGRRPGTRVLYVSPLKALGVDVERNLRSPLVGVTQTARRLGAEPPAISVGVRSGDTPSADRRALLAHPPDILITTPESLFLMLTSQARETLRDVETVIVDEVHAVAATKRGAHLAVSLERLDALLEQPAQRIGLSATVRPAEEVARFLGGRAPVVVVAPPSEKRLDLTVVVPVDDMSELGAAPPVEGSSSASTGEPTNGSIWPHVEEAVVDRILEHRSTIVFANSRRLAERLTSRLNEIHEQRVLDAAGGADADADALDADGGGTDVLGGGGPSRASARRRAPAEVIGASGQTRGSLVVERPTPVAVDPDDIPVLARAHHGSVSKEQRAVIEDDLKTGRLRCVVATSSLELGIDMGEVDLVIQVEAPPSVASGLQRVGRAGHQVGETSVGVLFPKHRADLVHTAVTAERMAAGAIEAIAVPANPLDVLAQQTVAHVALDPADAEEWFDVVRRSAPFASLPRSAYDATLDLLAGRYPSDEFAELRPRIVWDRDAGTLTGRPGAQRLAVTSGGTIPDRGMFGVFMVGEKAARVGELDEEMVYESRVGDVFALGATSWRIQEITHDRVLVTPAFGEPGRLPFWKGDGLGRPAELGSALGAFVRELGGASDVDARARCTAAGLDARATTNLLAFLAEQKAATEHLPTDRTLVLERFRDELGDWRIVLHSPFGMQIHAPWALAVGARVRERYALDGACVASDDGVIVRIPDTESEPPGAELFVFEPDELDALVTAEVGGSALFASRFRECAARALLLPRYDPGRRSPLWQQRQRAAQLLDVARKYPDFPIVLETIRECLQDVYDLPALDRLARDVAERRLRIVETTTESPSPFARSLLFGYVAAFMYEGDSPLAERRAAALSLDSALLADLLGRAELRELLDPAVIARVEADLQHTSPERRLVGLEGAADLVRMLGPVTVDEAAHRWVATREERDAEAGGGASGGDRDDVDGRGAVGSAGAAVSDGTPAPGGAPPTGAASDDAPASGDAPASAGASAIVDAPAPDDRDAWPDAESSEPPAPPVVAAALDPAVLERRRGEVASALDELVAARRALRVSYAGRDWYAAIEDASRLRDALGVPLPIGVPVAFVEPVADPLGDLVGRYARTHAPFTTSDAAARFGLGTAVVADALKRMERDRRLTEGEFTPSATGSEWCESGVLRRIRRLSLAALRHEVEPVDTPAFARFLPSWQHVGGRLRGVDGVATVIEQLGGARIPASAWETLVLPARVADYSPAMLDELTQTGEVIWAGAGTLPGSDGWVTLHLSDTADATLPGPEDHETDELQREVLAALSSGGAYFFRRLSDVVGSTDDGALVTALWDLVWAGLVTNDTLAPLRTLTAGGKGAHATPRSAPRARAYRGRGRVRPASVTRAGPPLASGRWSILPVGETDATKRAAAQAETLLERYGVVTRGSVVSEGAAGGFALAYKVLSRLEETGAARRGYFVETLGAAQFARGGTVDRLRSFARDDNEEAPREPLALAATDPANPYGAALPWPATVGDGTGHRPGRKAGALVALVDGRLVLYVERGGRTVLVFSDDEQDLAPAASALAALVRSRAVDKLTVETVGGEFVLGTAVGDALADAGFTATPRGLRLRS